MSESGVGCVLECCRFSVDEWFLSFEEGQRDMTGCV
jgi:hypothetical protein